MLRDNTRAHWRNGGCGGKDFTAIGGGLGFDPRGRLSAAVRPSDVGVSPRSPSAEPVRPERSKGSGEMQRFVPGSPHPVRPERSEGSDELMWFVCHVSADAAGQSLIFLRQEK